MFQTQSNVQTTACIAGNTRRSNGATMHQWFKSRRREPTNPVAVSPARKLSTHWVVIVSLIACWVSLTAAISLDPPAPRETLLLDNRVPIRIDGQWYMLSDEEHQAMLLRKRAASSVVTTTIAVPTSSSSSKTTTTSVSSSPLPSPFDASLSANFTGPNDNTNCPAFFNAFLTNSTFQQCYPFSLLVQGSQSFFQAEKSLVSITQVLDATCKADVNMCTTYLSNLAANLILDANCGADYKLQNSVVVEAYMGMVAYRTLYTASCLQDPNSSEYCFANAVTNTSAPSDVYFYYLPLNMSLPASANPTCDWCTQQTMTVFQAAAANRTLAIAQTYPSAAGQVNTLCGPNFVNATLPSPAKSASPLLQSPPLLLLTTLVLAISWFL